MLQNLWKLFTIWHFIKKMNLLLCFRGNLQILQQRFHHSLGRLQGLLEEILLGTDWRIWIRSHRSRMVIRMNYFLHYKLILSTISSNYFLVSFRFCNNSILSKFKLFRFFWTAKTENNCAPEWDYLFLLQNGVVPQNLCQRETFCKF